MKGKLFILLVMIGIPVMTWVFLAWVVMIMLGALHSVVSIIPPLSFWESFVATLMLFSIIAFAASAATEDAGPARWHGGR